jgi:glucose/mannose-6-phosphate isomerase
MKIQDLLKIDSNHMFKTYDLWPEIARESYENSLPKLDVNDIDHVVFAGMGGSGSIGDTISAILSKKDIHVSIVKGYTLPKTVDSKTIVIVTSVSGNTSETLQVLKTANKSSARVIGFASGGKMETYCKNEGISFQQISMIHSPRASFTRFLYSILNVLEQILPIEKKEILESITTLQNMQEEIFSGNLTSSNKALSLAEFTNDVTAIYYPGGFQSIATRYKNCLQENAKIHAMTENVIEACHNGIVSWEKKSVVKPVLIQGRNDHEKTIERWNILEKFFEEKKISYRKIDSIDGNILSKIINLIYLLDYSTIYSAVLSNTNPTSVDAIDYIKSKLE